MLPEAIRRTRMDFPCNHFQQIITGLTLGSRRLNSPNYLAAFWQEGSPRVRRKIRLKVACNSLR